jgi:predicted peptidase
VKIDRTQKPTEFIFDYSQNINWPLQSAVDLVKSLVKTKVADKKRLYIMGLSMGGMGTM